jgi:hypothetical protein
VVLKHGKLSELQMDQSINTAGCAGGSNIFIVHRGEFKAVVGDAPLLVKVVEIDAHEGRATTSCLLLSTR